MPWDRPTLKKLHERILRDFSGRLLDGGPVLARSVIAVLARIWAGACHLLHGLLDWIFLQVFADTAEGTYLERWARVWGIYRKGAAASVGTALFQGIDGAVLPAGSILIHQPSGQRYALAVDAELVDGQAGVQVRALEPGSAGDLPAGAPLSLIAPVAGVRADAVVAEGGLTGGVDAEGDEPLRARLLARLRRPPRGGAAHDYVAWALEVPGVTRAWCYPLGMGIGTVSLTFVTDDAPGGPIPTPEMVQRVQEHIDPLKPATAKEFLAFAPEPLPVLLRVSVIPDTSAVRAAVSAEIGDLFAREAAPGITILRSHIDEAISLAAGETDHALHEPEANIVVPDGYFPMLEPIDFETAS
ncbi:MAG: baseplate J/gp47 family protein [Desulfovibrio sp.]|jgi:uncharacterized phage protein gp47/JayE|nr:baseplate J/gp47 family protein [Desulfovibrio sp.]